MRIVYHDLEIRNAGPADCDQLARWWNDGSVMAHAGFPHGLGTTAEKIAAQIAADTDDTRRRLVIEYQGRLIGECSYRVLPGSEAEIGIKICELPASKLYLFKEQSHRGRVIVASKFHVSEMVDLSDEDRRAFLDDVAHVARALHKAFAPKKVNYGAYGDTGCHLHFHLVPKYEGGFEYGGVFEMNPKRTFPSPAEYDALIAEIKAAL